MEKHELSASAARRCCIVLFLFLFLTSFATAQLVTGTVLDNQNQPVYGATVSVKGTSKATITNAQGKFSINAGTNDVLIFTYVGLAAREVSLNGRTTLSVTLIRAD